MESRIRTRHRPWIWISSLLPLAACSGGTPEDAPLQQQARALTLEPPEHALLGEDPIDFLQKVPIASLGEAPVTLANGEQLRPDLAAEVSLARHREIAQEVSSGSSALYGAVESSEDFVETEETIELVARTRFVVRDPAALRERSPRFARLRLGDGPRPALRDLNPAQRAWFDALKLRVLQEPEAHPLGAAARKGDEALFRAALDGKGDITITTRVRAPKAGLQTQGSAVMLPTLSDGAFDFSHTQPRVGELSSESDLISVTQVGGEEEAEGMSFHSEGGERTGKSQFVNGFTRADAFDWGESWSFAIGSLHLGAGAGYGYGLRVPIVVTGTISPAEVWQFGGERDVRSKFETDLKVDVIDADSSFYEKAGMAAGDIQNGQELVLNASAYVHVRANLFGVINTNVTFGKGFDFGQNFRPPFDGCGTSCGSEFWIPSSYTNTGINISGIVTGEARVGFNFSGEGEVALKYESLYDGQVAGSSLGSADRDTHDLAFTSTDPKTFETKLARLDSHGEKTFGYRVADVEYDWDLVVTPGVRGDIHVNGGLFHFDETLKLWLNFAKIRLGTVHFDRHAGTRSSADVVKGIKRWSTFGKEQVEQDQGYQGLVYLALPEETEDGFCLVNGFCQATPIDEQTAITFEDGQLKDAHPTGGATIRGEELPLP